MAEPADPVEHKRLVHGARFRALPLNVRCRARCAFCYESTVSRLLPKVRTIYIPPYDEARFEAFRQMHERACEWEAATGREPAYSILPSLDRTPDGIGHFPNCDIFSSGLTHAQIEQFVRMRADDTCLLYAVGLDIDPDFIAYLTRTYPKSFRLHLSIVTFDRAIRSKLMHPDIDVDVLRRVCAVTRDATFFVMLFDAEQLASDVAQLMSSTQPHHGGLFIHKLYYDGCSPERVVAYARRAHGEREDAIRRIAELPLDGRPVWFSLGADLQAYTRRREIRALLRACTGSADEVVFSSQGAFAVIDDHFDRSANTVLAMDCAFGGNVDLVQGATARNVIDQLERLRSAGGGVRQVWLPDAMFWIDGECDVNGDTVNTVRDAFPDLSVDLLEVPGQVMWSVVSLADCQNFFAAAQRAKFEAPQ